MLEEENQRLLDMLRDDTQREIATLRMSGYSNEEIAEKSGVSLRSVVRNLGVVREVWSQLLSDDEYGTKKTDRRATARSNDCFSVRHRNQI